MCVKEKVQGGSGWEEMSWRRKKKPDHGHLIPFVKEFELHFDSKRGTIQSLKL